MTVGPTNSSLPIHIARAYQLAPRQPVMPKREAPSLAAASVQGQVSFEQLPAARSGPSLAMYTNPAMRNAAATGVQLGRLIDAEG